MMTSNVRNLLGITFTLALLSMALTSTALASEPETHDGFMLRFVTGLGYHHSSFDANGLTYSFDGMGAGGGLALGGVVTENLAVHGEFFGTTVVDPTLEVKGSSGAAISGETNAKLTVGGLGAGVTYFVMPLNLYVSGTLGFAIATLETNGTKGETDTGFGLNMLVGKEWWVSEEAGIGVAGQLLYTSVPTKAENLSTVAFNVLFSVTYN